MLGLNRVNGNPRAIRKPEGIGIRGKPNRIESNLLSPFPQTHK